MAELDVNDVVTFTRGRLSASDTVVQDMLKAALVRARHYVGHPVSPVSVGDVVNLRGPGGRELYLPTGKIVSVASIVENGVTVDPANYAVSTDIPNMVYRKDGCWACESGSITVTFTHGFTEDEAADWRRAILQMVDLMARSQQSGARSDDDLKSKKVHNVEYEWIDYLASADREITSVESTLEHYRLAPTGFA